MVRRSLKSGPATRDQDPETWDPDPRTLRPRTLGLWDPDTQDRGTGTLGHGTLTPRTLQIGPWYLELATLRPRTELVMQIPSILTRTTDWINFNSEANFDNKKLGHLSQKLDSGARVGGPKHLPKYFDIGLNTKLTMHKVISKLTIFQYNF